jgi:hypothetical protein
MQLINDCIASQLIGQEERENFVALKKKYDETDLLSEHQGRYVLIRKGKMYMESFETPQDTFTDEFDDDCMLFQVPRRGGSLKASSFLSHVESVAMEGNTLFDECKIPVKFIVEKEGFKGESVCTRQFLLDTGASDTSCCN